MGARTPPRRRVCIRLTAVESHTGVTVGQAHPTALISRSNLAQLLAAQGRVAEAEPLMRLDLQSSIDTRGEFHAETLLAYSNLARCLAVQGKQHEATPLLKRELLIHRRLHGEDAPQTLDCLHSLVHLLQQQARCRPLCIVTATTTATPIS